MRQKQAKAPIIDVSAHITKYFFLACDYSLKREGTWPGSAQCGVDGDAGKGDYFSGATRRDITDSNLKPSLTRTLL